MSAGMLFFGLFFMGGWAAALGALVFAVVTLVRVWPRDWMRRRGHPAARLLPAPAFLRFDVALAVTALLADLWLVSAAIVLGTEGIFTEDWMGYPGMADSTGRGYQAEAVSVLRSIAWWTFGIAALGRCWITAGVQLCLLPLAAWWIGTFDTYFT
ncbi:hypothetical protein [Streptomyces sp. NPDC050546]|uniref:hypothetical protein n=1 Tax=Streptomyces sp. NPDC050546 TaxID=3365628 RepID=UPI0037BA50E6